MIEEINSGSVIWSYIGKMCVPIASVGLYITIKDIAKYYLKYKSNPEILDKIRSDLASDLEKKLV